MSSADTPQTLTHSAPGISEDIVTPRRWFLYVAHHFDPQFIRKRIELPMGMTIEMGRPSNDKENAPSAYLDDAKISQRHMKFRPLQGSLELETCGKNGVYVSGRLVGGGYNVAKEQLKDADVIMVPTTTEPILMIVRSATASTRADVHRNIIGESAEIAQLIEDIKRFGPGNGSVLITGENGSGKELVAQALHAQSKREGRLVPSNCSRLDEHQLESQLFGHVKGAFTGALRSHDGLIVEAQNGTLFLDEFHTLTVLAQNKLLRFLEDKKVRPMGSSADRVVDTRIIAALNVNLENLVRLGQFKNDLYFRIRGSVVQVPSLRERMDDLPLLIEHFLKSCREPRERPLHHHLLHAFLLHPWPGNVRELENVLAVAMKSCSNPQYITKSPKVEELLRKSCATIQPPSKLQVDVPTVARPVSPPNESPTAEPAASRTNVGNEQKRIAPITPARKQNVVPREPISKETLLDTIKKHNGVIASAAKTLGYSRQGLYKALEKIGVDPRKARE